MWVSKRQIGLLLIIIFTFLPCHAQSGKDMPDDILEFIPAASVIGLKACGVKSKDKYPELLMKTGMAIAVMGLSVETLKHTVHSERPDKSNDHGFPSGHAAISFLGADILFEEYRDVSPWIGIGGYAVAATTSYLRVKHDRHHWVDVLGGAAIGIGCSRLGQWLTPKILRKENDNVTFTPTLSSKKMGLEVCVNF